MSDNTDFVAEARTKCAMSIRNTAVGDWLGDALRRLEEADAENAQLRERCHELTDLCDNRLRQRWDENTEYRAETKRLREGEIERLREALEEIEKVARLGAPSQCAQRVQRVARQALGGGDDE